LRTDVGVQCVTVTVTMTVWVVVPLVPVIITMKLPNVVFLTVETVRSAVVEDPEVSETLGGLRDVEGG
jgi:hypothetical protein